LIADHPSFALWQQRSQRVALLCPGPLLRFAVKLCGGTQYRLAIDLHQGIVIVAIQAPNLMGHVWSSAESRLHCGSLLAAMLVVERMATLVSML
jgi:hypothetical protein